MGSTIANIWNAVTPVTWIGLFGLVAAFIMIVEFTFSKKEKAKNQSGWEYIKIILILIIAICITVYIAVIYFMEVNKLYGSLPERGAFGDQFGALNAIFTGTALISMVVSLMLQRIEMKEDRASKNAIRKEELQDRALIQLFEDWHSMSMEKSKQKVTIILNSKDLHTIIKNLWGQTSPDSLSPAILEDLEALELITSFWYRCCKLHESQLIDRYRYSQLFIRDIEWWYEHLFRFTDPDYLDFSIVDKYKSEVVLPAIKSMMWAVLAFMFPNDIYKGSLWRRLGPPKPNRLGLNEPPLKRESTVTPQDPA